MCLPFTRQASSAHGECVDTAEWLCPSTWLAPPPPPLPAPAPPAPPPAPPPWRPHCHDTPSPHFEGCLESHCCVDAFGFGCFRRVDREWAQCLPLSHQKDAHGACVDTDEWLCPRTWLHPPPPPAPPPPAPRPSPPPARFDHARCYAAPSEHFASCWASRCCVDARGFGCFKRPGKQFALCLPWHTGAGASGAPTADPVTDSRLSEDGCSSSASWLCPQAWLPTAPNPHSQAALPMPAYIAGAVTVTAPPRVDHAAPPHAPTSGLATAVATALGMASATAPASDAAREESDDAFDALSAVLLVLAPLCFFGFLICRRLLKPPSYAPDECVPSAVDGL